MIRKQIEELSTNYQFWIRILKHATVALNQICVSVISCLSDYNTTEQIIKIKHSFQLLLEWLIIYLDCPLYNRPCQYQSDVVIEILWDLMIWSQNMQNFCVKFSIDVIAPLLFISLLNEVFWQTNKAAPWYVWKQQWKLIKKPSFIDDIPAQRKH